MRVEVLDSETKTLTARRATYIVYYTGCPFAFIANLRHRSADYILQVWGLIDM